MSQVKGGHITGNNKGKVVMYGLSTCVWCKKTRQLLTDLGVDFDYVYVDLLSDDEEENAIKVVKRFNPSVSFPTVIVNEKEQSWVLTNMQSAEHLVLKRNACQCHLIFC